MIFGVLAAAFASRLAPTGECISNVGASLLAKRSSSQTLSNRNSRSHELITRLKFSCSARLTAT
ncbi:hypothetical protein F6476_12490 [Pseudomonas umsongensis]|nr:hypothetical protein F6476_12490 [Pseudomonas umsongensis]